MLVLALAPWCLGCSRAPDPSARDAASGFDASPIHDALPDSAPDYASPLAVRRRLERSLADLAALGEKRAGTPAGVAAGEYVLARMVRAGLLDVQVEPFSFLGFDLASSSLSVTVDGEPMPMAHEVFAYTGSGRGDGQVVYVGDGAPSDYDGVEAAGRIVLVRRNPTYHRIAQYRYAVEHGAVAMLYVSGSPENLIQIGVVHDVKKGLGPIPAASVGQKDGDSVISALLAGRTVRAVLAVSASTSVATGRNVVGRLPGTEPGGGYFVVGAHYDTWHVGSIDNSSGVAALLELAAALAQDGPRRFGLAFVAYDAEEVGLLGGYDFLRQHIVAAGEPALAFLNLEMPANSDAADLRAIAATSEATLQGAIADTGITSLYTILVGLDFVAPQFGGVIPTDIQGMYWYGLHGYTTFCDTAYYHTAGDTPAKVDTVFLAQAVLGHRAVLDALDYASSSDFSVADPALWRIEVNMIGTEDVVVDMAIANGAGMAQAGAFVEVTVDVDDFFQVFAMRVTTNGEGRAQVTIPSQVGKMGAGSRWLHVTAGRGYPLAEAIARLPILPSF